MAIPAILLPIPGGLAATGLWEQATSPLASSKTSIPENIGARPVRFDLLRSFVAAIGGAVGLVALLWFELDLITKTCSNQ
jgi:hypothetical protein